MIPTKAQRDVWHRGGLREEQRAAKWLERHHWMHVDYKKKKHTGCYDIEAKKGGKVWVVEVKSGRTPPVKIENLIKMLRMKKVQVTALLFVPKNCTTTPLLFTLSREEYRAWKASDTKTPQVEKAAGLKMRQTKRRKRYETQLPKIP